MTLLELVTLFDAFVRREATRADLDAALATMRMEDLADFDRLLALEVKAAGRPPEPA